MPRGKSGRIVLEIDTELKRKLYLTLEKDQKTLREWFIENAVNYISEDNISLFLAAEPKAKYEAKKHEL
ncbi:MAG: hypothetical protein SCALA702_29820 [Melioribacteraceae bacterium]|nr:MAG: hypothetical protein SCALA702_29820 [Melioribacteraceae bacterium]